LGLLLRLVVGATNGNKEGSLVPVDAPTGTKDPLALPACPG